MIMNDSDPMKVHLSTVLLRFLMFRLLSLATPKTRKILINITFYEVSSLFKEILTDSQELSISNAY